MADITNFTYEATTYLELFSNATRDEYIRPFDTVGVALSGLIIFTFLVVGFFLNSLTMMVILNTQKLRNIFMYFIFSLCVSDLISAIISPFFWYRRTLGFDLWEPPDFFCKFYWAADLATSFSTAMHVMSFAILRYISIRFPHSFRKITINMALIWIVLIWIVSIGCGFVPFYIFFGARFRDRYSNEPDARWPSCTINREWYEAYTSFQRIAYPIFLYAPIVIVVCMSLLIAFTVLNRSKSPVVSNTSNKEKERRKERQAVLQLLLIVFSFLFGYIPFTAYEFWSVQRHPSTRYYQLLDYWFGTIEYFFLRFSECMNPIFYNLGSTKMRRFTRNYLADKFKCIHIRKDVTISESSQGNISSPTASHAM